MYIHMYRFTYGAIENTAIYQIVFFIDVYMQVIGFVVFSRMEVSRSQTCLKFIRHLYQVVMYRHWMDIPPQEVRPSCREKPVHLSGSASGFLNS